MSDTTGAVLIAEIGSLTTRVTLVDQVGGESRMIGRAETISTIEPPYQNALFAVLEAAAQIAEGTGRILLRDGQLAMPQTNERDGINHLIAVSSAAGTMAVVITAIASDVSARSALHAARSTYTSVLQIVTLDDAAAHPVDNQNLSWIERQVQSLLALQPDVVMIAGGLEGGAVDALNRLAHIVGLTALRSSVDAGGQQRQDITARPVIFAGNHNARERVLEALSDKAEMFMVDNVRPTLDQERLEPACRELSRLYDKYILPQLPGLPVLRRLSRTPLTTVVHAEGLITRYLAERYGRRTLTLDIGAAGSSSFIAIPEAAGSARPYHLAVLGNCGTGYGLTTVLAERGVANIARWLPFTISEADLTHRLLNKVLRPHLMPASREDLYIEHAVVREAIALLLAALYDEYPNTDHDLVVAGGGVLAHVPQPGMAALILLDALQPTGEPTNAQVATLLALDMHLDTLGLLPACGALAGFDPDAAVTVFDRDALRNLPLATCIVTLGDSKPGEIAVEAELVVLGGGAQRVSVHHGQIARLPLEYGAKAQLILRPAAGVRIGSNPPGVEVSSDVAAISGSALGVVIDARGRPLALPAGDRQRCAQIWEWLVALGAEQGQSPYVDASLSATPTEVGAATEKPLNGNALAAGLGAAPSDAPGAPETAALTPGKRISLSDLAAQDVPPPAGGTEAGKPGKRISLSDLAAQDDQPPAAPPPPNSLESDLAKLRQTVEEPKKRGLFGRKK